MKQRRGSVSGAQFVDLLRSKQEAGAAPNDPVVDDVFMSIQVDKMNLIKNCILGKQESSKLQLLLQNV